MSKSHCLCLTKKNLQCKKYAISGSNQCKIHQKCEQSISQKSLEKNPSLTKKKSIKKIQTEEKKKTRKKTLEKKQARTETTTTKGNPHKEESLTTKQKSIHQIKNKFPADIQEQKLKQSKIMYEKQIDYFVRFYSKKDMLLGIVGLSLFNCAKKKLLILHDWHIEFPQNKEKNSFIIYDFLDELFRLSQNCTDFMLETSEFYLPAHHNARNVARQFLLSENTLRMGLTGTMNIFAKCLNVEKYTCSDLYPFIRFHNIEIRREATRFYSLNHEGFLLLPLYALLHPNRKKIYNDDLQLWVRQRKKHSDPPIFSFKNNKNLETFIEFLKGTKNTNRNEPPFETLFIALLDGDYLKIYDFFSKFVTLFPGLLSRKFQEYYTFDNIKKQIAFGKIFKQMNSLQNVVNVKYLRNIFHQDFLFLHLSFLRNLSFVKGLEDSAGFFNLYHNFLLQFGVFINDIYTMLRLLKILLIYPDSSFVIVYAGQTHTMRLEKWCKKQLSLNFEKILELGNSDFEKASLLESLEGISVPPYVELKGEKYQKWQTFLNLLANILKQRSHSCQIKNSKSK